MLPYKRYNVNKLKNNIFKDAYTSVTNHNKRTISIKTFNKQNKKIKNQKKKL